MQISLRAAILDAGRISAAMRRLQDAVAGGVPEGRKRAAEYERRRILERFSTAGRTGDFGVWDEIDEESRRKRKERKGGDPPLWDTGALVKDFAEAHVEGGRLWFDTEHPGWRALDQGFSRAAGAPGGDDDDDDDSGGGIPARPFGYISRVELEAVPRLYLGELAELIDEAF